MKAFILVFLSLPLVGFSLGLNQGKIISARHLKTLSCDASNTIETWAVRYVTLDVKGEPTQASGFVSYPKTSDSLPLIAYHHGTVLNREQVPSRGLQDKMVCLYGKGAIVSAPDYLGMGDSAGYHPYIHAKSEALSSLDLIRAARLLVLSKHKKWDGRLYLTGYSQGGHVTMALFKELSTTNTEFKVTAVAPLAGAYDLSEVTLKTTLTDPDPYNSAVYTAFLVASYDQLYPMEKFINLVLPNYRQYVKAFLYMDPTVLTQNVPQFPSQMFAPETVDSLLKNSEHPFVRALRANNVYDFKPTAPTLFCYAGGDKSVSPQNAIVASKRFIELGGQAELLNVGDHLNHSTGAADCHTAAFKFFMAH